MTHRPLRALLAAAALAVFPGAAPGELPRDVVARVDGVPITAGEFHAFVGREFHTDARAQQLLEHLIQQTVIRVESERAGVAVDRDELERRYRRLDDENAERARQSLGREKSLGEVLAEQGVTKEEFLAELEVSLLAERMARREFDVPPRADVPYAKTNLWIRDRVGKAIVKRSDLAPGEVARVNGRAIGEAEFGRRYLRDLGAKERRDLLTEFIDTRVIERAASDAGIELRAADLDAAIEVRRSTVARDPKYVGASLEELLEKTGRSVEWLKGSSRFRNQVLMERLLEARWPGESLKSFYDLHVEEIDRVHGPSVRLRGVFLRAGHEGATVTGFTPRLYEEAEKELLAVRDRVAAGRTTLEDVARGRSEHEESMRKAGDLGFLRRGAPRLEAVVAAAMDDPRDRTPIGPIRTVDGVWLVEVLERRPRPTYDEIEREVRNFAAAKLFRELRASAAIERRE